MVSPDRTHSLANFSIKKASFTISYPYAKMERGFVV